MTAPTNSLTVKLASAIVHAQEFMAPDGHPLDKEAFDSLVKDPEVVEAMEELNSMAMLPVRRDT